MKISIILKEVKNIKSLQNPNPFVSIDVKLGTKSFQKFKTKVLKKTLNPKWDITFDLNELQSSDLANLFIIFYLKNWDLSADEDLIVG